MLHAVHRTAKKIGREYFLAYGTLLGAVRHRGFIPWDTDVDIYVHVDDLKGFVESLSLELPKAYKVVSADKGNSYPYLFPRIVVRGRHHADLHLDIFVLSQVPNSGAAQWLIGRIFYVIFRMYSVKKLDMGYRFQGHRRRYMFGIFLKVLLLPIPVRLLLYLHERLLQWSPRRKSDFVINSCGTYGRREIFPSVWFSRTSEFQFEDLMLTGPASWEKYLVHVYGDYLTPKQSNYLS